MARDGGREFCGVALTLWIKPGDILRSNAEYDTSSIDSYEDMGIAVAYISPDNPDGTPTAPGLDPFTAPVDEILYTLTDRPSRVARPV